jgi:hypothetical protein
MCTRSFVVSAAVLLMFTGVTDPVAAQGPTDPAAFALSPSSRVRCLDREARRLMEVAMAASPTFARVVIDLQSTDLIVGIETDVLNKKGLKGEARIAAATPVVRHVRIRIGIPGVQASLISVLGHELQHAMEIASAPDVRDAATLRTHYLRIGYEPTGQGYYETDAALETGREVSAEVAASQRHPRVAGR